MERWSAQQRPRSGQTSRRRPGGAPPHRHDAHRPCRRSRSIHAFDQRRRQPAVEEDAHGDTREERQGELDPAHRALARLTARTYPAGGAASRCGSDQRAVIPARVRAAGLGFNLADWAMHVARPLPCVPRRGRTPPRTTGRTRCSRTGRRASRTAHSSRSRRGARPSPRRATDHLTRRGAEAARLPPRLRLAFPKKGGPDASDNHAARAPRRRGDDPAHGSRRLRREPGAGGPGTFDGRCLSVRQAPAGSRSRLSRIRSRPNSNAGFRPAPGGRSWNATCAMRCG
jgi:hypothetical protein